MQIRIHPRNYLIISTMKNSVFRHLEPSDIQYFNLCAAEKFELKKFGNGLFCP